MATNGFSPAGQSLFGGGVGGMAGLTGVAGLGDQLESDEERKKRLAQIAQQRQLLTQRGSPATQSLFGSPFAGFNGTGLIR